MSAFSFRTPGRWVILNLYSCNLSDHLASLPDANLIFCNQVKLIWSVNTSNSVFAKYGWYVCTASTNAYPSFSVTDHLFSEPRRFRAAPYAMTRSWLLSSNWLRMYPIAKSEAPTAIRKLKFRLGNASIGEDVSFSFKSLKTASHLCPFQAFKVFSQQLVLKDALCPRTLLRSGDRSYISLRKIWLLFYYAALGSFWQYCLYAFVRMNMA